MLSAGCAALGLLAACGSDTPEQGTANPTVAGPAPGGGLVKVSDVPVGSGVVTADGTVLVLQLKKGEFTAFDTACPHQSFRVQPPDSSGNIVCPGHMSHFKTSDGTAIDGPALGLDGLRKVAVKVSGAEVVRA